jgi:hypothetical protein
MSNKLLWGDRDRQTRRNYLSKGGEFDTMNRAQLTISTILIAVFSRAVLLTCKANAVV